MFTLTIDNLDNAAFVDAGPRYELARILRQLADHLEAGRDPSKIYDLNGNAVGSWQLGETTDD